MEKRKIRINVFNAFLLWRELSFAENFNLPKEEERIGGAITRIANSSTVSSCFCSWLLFFFYCCMLVVVPSALLARKWKLCELWLFSSPPKIPLYFSSSSSSAWENNKSTPTRKKTPELRSLRGSGRRNKGMSEKEQKFWLCNPFCCCLSTFLLFLFFL